MAKQFGGFTPQQTATLLQKMGYTGPADPKAMQQYLAASPAAAAKLGKYTETAQRMISGAPASQAMPPATQGRAKAFAEGGWVSSPGTTVLTYDGNPNIKSFPKFDEWKSQQSQENPLPDATLQEQFSQQRNAHNAKMNEAIAALGGDPNAGLITVTGGKENPVQSDGTDSQGNPVSQETLDTIYPEGKYYKDADGNIGVVAGYADLPEGATQLDKTTYDTMKSQQDADLQYQQDMQTGQREMMSASVNDPASLVTDAEATKIATDPSQQISENLGTLEDIAPVDAKQATATQTAAPKQAAASSYTAAKVGNAVTTEAAQGTVSEDAQTTAAQGDANSLAQLSLEAQQIDKAREIAAVPDMTVSADQLAEAAKASNIPAADAATSAYQSTLTAMQGAVAPESLVDPNNILNRAEAVTAIAASMDALNQSATALAVQGEFTPEALAVAAQGSVPALATVQGQLASLMQSFNDGTPAWAAGAMRSANAAMAARGLGGSSMAGAAIVQAAMESALPIAQADAPVFAQMEFQNLDNRQKVALANAAAQQNIQLVNLSNAQQTALQNSANAFALQSQNLSNQQQVVLANAQFKASLQEKSLDINTQVALTNAARYAEINSINLNNAQQAALQRSAENLQVEIANLSNKQQTALTNAQIEASIRGQELTNQQQTNIVNAARISEIANVNFSAKQQRAVENARLAQTVDIANLDARNAKLLSDAAAMSQMDMANLSYMQQAAVTNAQAFLQMDMANLNNEQQALIFNAQARNNVLLSDAAAENAARQFNASSKMQTDQFNANLTSTVAMANTAQLNAMNQFNAGEANAIAKLNAEMELEQQKFEATMGVQIAQANAQWAQSVATADAAAENAANLQNALAATSMTKTSLDNLYQRERDQMQYAYGASEGAANRAADVALAKLTADEAAKLADNVGKGTFAAALADGAIDAAVAWFKP